MSQNAFTCVHLYSCTLLERSLTVVARPRYQPRHQWRARTTCRETWGWISPEYFTVTMSLCHNVTEGQTHHNKIICLSHVVENKPVSYWQGLEPDTLPSVKIILELEWEIVEKWLPILLRGGINYQLSWKLSTIANPLYLLSQFNRYVK